MRLPKWPIKYNPVTSKYQLEVNAAACDTRENFNVITNKITSITEEILGFENIYVNMSPHNYLREFATLPSGEVVCLAHSQSMAYTLTRYCRDNGYLTFDENMELSFEDNHKMMMVHASLLIDLDKYPENDTIITIHPQAIASICYHFAVVTSIQYTPQLEDLPDGFDITELHIIDAADIAVYMGSSDDILSEFDQAFTQFESE